MSPAGAGEVVVLARGGLAWESPALALRVALALPLGGLRPRLLLLGPASLLALADGPELSAWAGSVEGELGALSEEGAGTVLVEGESLAELGLGERALRAGVEVVSRGEVARLCSSARHCLVL